MPIRRMSEILPSPQSVATITIAAIIGLNVAKWFNSRWRIPGVGPLIDNA